MDLLRIHRCFGEHRFRGHPKVAFRVIRGNMPFVPEKELGLAPRHHCLQHWVVQKQAIQRFRCGTTRERDAEGALFSDSLLRCLQEFRGGCLRNAIGIRQNSGLTICCCSLSRHSLSAPLQSLFLSPPEPHSPPPTHVPPPPFPPHLPRTTTIP